MMTGNHSVSQSFLLCEKALISSKSEAGNDVGDDENCYIAGCLLIDITLKPIPISLN